MRRIWESCFGEAYRPVVFWVFIEPTRLEIIRCGIRDPSTILQGFIPRLKPKPLAVHVRGRQGANHIFSLEGRGMAQADTGTVVFPVNESGHSTGNDK